jgi:hypothetical protein
MDSSRNAVASPAAPSTGAASEVTDSRIRRSVGDHLTGRRPDAGAQAASELWADLASERRQRLPQLGRGPYGPQRVVLVQQRHPEDRHQDVPGVVLDSRAMPFEHRADAGKRVRDQAPAELSIEAIMVVGRLQETDEQHRHGLADLPCGGGQLRRARSALLAQLEHPLGPRQAAQLVHAEVHQLHAVGKAVADDLHGGLRQQRRAAVGEPPEPCRAVESRAEVVAGALVRLARVKRNPHPQVDLAVPADPAERSSQVGGTGEGVRRAGEHAERRVALSLCLEQAAFVVPYGPLDKLVVKLEGGGHRPRVVLP